MAAVIGLGGLVAVTGGCAVAESVPYPSLGGIKRITKRILTPEEKEAQIRDLALEQKRHREDAEREIEKR